jgi:hypothetical protein
MTPEGKRATKQAIKFFADVHQPWNKKKKGILHVIGALIMGLVSRREKFRGNLLP